MATRGHTYMEEWSLTYGEKLPSPKYISITLTLIQVNCNKVPHPRKQVIKHTGCYCWGYSPSTLPDSKVYGANMGPIWGQMGPMLAPWTLLSVLLSLFVKSLQPTTVWSSNELQWLDWTLGCHFIAGLAIITRMIWTITWLRPPV